MIKGDWRKGVGGRRGAGGVRGEEEERSRSERGWETEGRNKEKMG